MLHHEALKRRLDEIEGRQTTLIDFHLEHGKLLESLGTVLTTFQEGLGTIGDQLVKIGESTEAEAETVKKLLECEKELERRRDEGGFHVGDEISVPKKAYQAAVDAAKRAKEETT